ncbi:MAG: hypothetical protein P1Q69_09480 [Candidatus Thorarchaeota archaeon]|nr:hypothetical protein [Candidatus Thorarchaeota archaeon]
MISKVFQELWDFIEIPDTKTRLGKVNKWLGAHRGTPGACIFNEEEQTRLLEKSLGLLGEPDFTTCESVVRCIAISTPRLDLPPLEMDIFPDLKREPPFFPSLRYEDSYIVHILRQWGVFAPDERVIISDVGNLTMGSQNLRRGDTLFVTDRRIVCMGNLSGPFVPSAPSYRFLYDNWEEQPHIQVYDYLDFGNIKNIQSHWSRGKKIIEIEYQSKYVKEKGRTIYGPYFFKLDLPKTEKIEEGILNTKLDLVEIPYKEYPKDYRKYRQERLVNLVQDAGSWIN